MTRILLLSLALLCVGSASAILPLRSCDGPWDCATVTSQDLNPGQRLVFRYRARISARVPGKGSPISLNINTIATIDSYNCRRTLKLSQTKITSTDGGRKASAKDFLPVVRTLERTAAYFRTHNGRVDSFCSKDPVWAANVKRGFLSIWQLSNVASNRVSSRVVDVLGDCPITFARFGFRLYLIRRIAACKNHHKTFGGLQSEAYNAPSPIQNPSISATQRCTFVHRRSQMNNKFAQFPKISCSERMTTPSFASSFVPLKSSDVLQELEFKTSNTFKCVSNCENRDKLKSFRMSGLEMQFEPSTPRAISSKVAASLVCRLAGPIRPESPQLFSQLVRFLRSCSDAQWRSIVYKRRNSLCPKLSASVVENTITDALAMAGDPRSIRHIAKIAKLPSSRKDALLSSVAFAKRPTEKLLTELVPVFKQFQKLPRASLATAALLNRFCDQRKPKSCDRAFYFRFLTKPLMKQLSETRCQTMDVARGTLLFRILGNLPVPASDQRHFLRCADRTKAPTVLRVAAIQAMRRSACPQTPFIRRSLVRILETRSNDIELRAAAYHQLLRCPSKSLSQDLTRALSKLRSQHLTSYIASHIANIRAANDPDQRTLRYFLHDLKWRPKVKIPDGFSRYYQRSFYSPARNLGVRANGHLLWSENSATPRSVSAGISAHLFGRTVNLMEMRSRAEGVGELMNRYWWPQHQRKLLPPSKADFQLGLRLFGHDLLADHKVLTPSTMSRVRSRNIIEKMLKDLAPKTRQNFVFTDQNIVFATGAGLPLTVSAWGAISIELEAKTSSKRVRKVRSDYNLRFKPAAAVSVQTATAFELSDLRFGGKSGASAHTNVELDWTLTLHVKREKGCEVRLNAPKRQEFLNLKWSTSSLHLNDARPVSGQSSPSAVTKSSRAILGYRMMVRMQRSPFTPVSSFGNSISISADRIDSHTMYYMKAVVNKNSLELVMDTPGSKTNRRIVGKLQNQKPKTIEVDLMTPKGRLQGKIGEIRNKPRTTIYLTGKFDGKKMIDIRWQYYRKRPVAEHTLKAIIGPRTVASLNVKITDEKRGASFVVKLEDIVHTPVVVKGSVKRIPANKWSIGALNLVSLNMTSSFLEFDYNRKWEKSDRKFDGMMQLNYKLPKVPKSKGSVSMKVGWVRLSDKTYRDRFTFKSFASHLPQINSDIVLKSNYISVMNFRQQVTVKVSVFRKPITGSLRFLMDTQNPKAQAMTFQLDYQVPMIAKGEALIRYEMKRKFFSFVTKLRQVTNGVVQVDHSMSINSRARGTIDASLSFASDLTRRSLKAQFRKLPNFSTTFVIDLKTLMKMEIRVRPWIREVIGSLRYDQWKVKGRWVQNRGRQVSYTLSENSQYGFLLSGSYRIRLNNVRFSQSLKRNSGRLYGTTFGVMRQGKKWMGDLSFGVGLVSERQRLKMSFTQDNLKNLHTSSAELLIGTESMSLRNDYSFEVSSRQKINGRSHFVSTFKGRKRKLMLQTNINNLRRQLSSDFQFSSSLDGVPSFVNVKFNIKDKNPYNLAFSASVDSSMAKLKSADFDYRHILRSKSFKLDAIANYMKSSYKLVIGGTKGKDPRNFSGRVSVGIAGIKRAVSIASKFTSPVHSRTVSLELGDKVYDAAMTSTLGGHNAGKVTVTAKGASNRLVAWKVGQSLTDIDISFDIKSGSVLMKSALKVSKSEIDAVVDFTQIENRVQLRKVFFKLLTKQPMLKIDIRRRNVPIILVDFSRKKAQWNFLSEIKTQISFLVVDAKAEVKVDLSNELVFSGNLNGFGRNILSVDYNPPMDKVKISSNCGSGVPFGCSLDFNFAPVAAQLSTKVNCRTFYFGTTYKPQGSIGISRALPKKLNVYLRFGKFDGDINYEASGITASSLKLKRKIGGKSLMIELKANLDKSKVWTQTLKVTSPELNEPITGKFTWITAVVRLNEDNVYGAIPKRLLQLKEIKFSVGQTTNRLSGLGRWDRTSKNGLFSVNFLDPFNIKHELKLQVTNGGAKIDFNGVILSTRFAAISQFRRITASGKSTLQITAHADLPAKKGYKYVKVGVLKATSDGGKYKMTLSGPFVASQVSLTEDIQLISVGPGYGVSKLGLQENRLIFSPPRGSFYLKNSYNTGGKRWNLITRFLVQANSKKKRVVCKRFKYSSKVNCRTVDFFRKASGQIQMWLTKPRYGGFTYDLTVVPSSKFRYAVKQRYVREPRFTLVERTYTNQIMMYTSTMKEKSKVIYSPSGRFDSLSYQSSSQRQRGRNRARTLSVIQFAADKSKLALTVGGEIYKRALLQDNKNGKVFLLRLQHRPKLNMVLRTGLNARVMPNKKSLFVDFRGNQGISGGKMALTTFIGSRKWMDSILSYIIKSDQQGFNFKYTRRPQGKPVVAFDLLGLRKRGLSQLKFDMTKGKRNVIRALLLNRIGMKTVMLSLDGAPHFTATHKRLSRGFEITMKTLSMKRPSRLRVTRTIGRSMKVEIFPQSDVKSRLTIDLLRTRSRDILILKKFPNTQLMMANLLRTRRGFNFRTNIRMASPLRFNVEETSDRRGTVYQFGFNGKALTGRLGLQRYFTAVVKTSQRPLLQISCSSKAIKIRVGSRAFFDLMGNSFTVKDGRSSLLKAVWERPTYNTLSTQVAWRPHGLWNAIEEVGVAVETEVQRLCRYTIPTAVRNLQAFNRQLIPKKLMVLSDFRNTFLHAARIVGPYRAALRAVAMLQISYRSTLRSLERTYRSILQKGSQFTFDPNMLVLVNAQLQSMAQDAAKLYYMPDKLSNRVGKAANAAAILAVQRTVRNLNSMKKGPNATPGYQTYVNKAAQQIQKAKAVLLQIAQKMKTHANQQLVKDFQIAQGKLLQLQSQVNSRMQTMQSYMGQMTPKPVRRGLAQYMQASIPTIQKSKLVTNSLISLRHRMTQYARGNLMFSPPEVKQLNWHHGKVHVVWHMPVKPIQPALLAPPKSLSFPSPFYNWYSMGFRRKEARLSGVSVRTFDGLTYNLRRTCSTILAQVRQPARREFFWRIRFRQYKQRRSVDIQLGRLSRNRIEIRSNGEVRYQRKRIPLPSRQKVLWQHKAYFNRIGKKVVIEAGSTYGFRLETIPENSYVRIILTSPHFFNNIEGLFGNADQRSSNDLATPTRPWNRDVNYFLRKIARNCV